MLLCVKLTVEFMPALYFICIAIPCFATDPHYHHHPTSLFLLPTITRHVEHIDDVFSCSDDKFPPISSKISRNPSKQNGSSNSIATKVSSQPRIPTIQPTNKNLHVSIQADMKKIKLSFKSFRNISTLINSNKQAYITYRLPDEKCLNVVLRNILNQISLNEIREDVQSMGFYIKKIHRMYKTDKDGFNMLFHFVLVTLPNKSQSNKIFDINISETI